MYYQTYSERNKTLVEENTFIGKSISENPLPTFDEAKDRLPEPVWENHDDYIKCYRRAWEIAFRNLKKPKEGTGFVSDFIDTAFNGCTFMWDSAFMLMFGKYAQRIFNFQGTLDNFYSHQHRDGFICREIDENTGAEKFSRYDPSATGPEVLPWCEWEFFLNFGDMERLKKVFPPLMAYHRWMAENHTWPDGTYFSSGWGCGMDNIPRMMPEYNVRFSHGHMVWVDACMQGLLSCNVLLDMAKTLGRNEYIKELEDERDNLIKVANEKLWDEETGFYYDLWKTGEWNYTQHIGAYWSLLADCVPEERAERMIAHLEDEGKFNTHNPIPALSKDHSGYMPNGGYWRGGVWAPTNYMVLKGLDKYKRYDLSHKIAVKYLRAVVEVFKKTGTLYELYAPEYIDDEFSQASQKGDFVGWTGLAPISVLFEYVFGIKSNTVENKIEWHINLTEEHGVKKYPFGNNGELTLICKKRTDIFEKPEIIFESDVPVTLEVFWGENNKQSFTIKNKLIKMEVTK